MSKNYEWFPIAKCLPRYYFKICFFVKIPKLAIELVSQSSLVDRSFDWHPGQAVFLRKFLPPPVLRWAHTAFPKWRPGGHTVVTLKKEEDEKAIHLNLMHGVLSPQSGILGVLGYVQGHRWTCFGRRQCLTGKCQMGSVPFYGISLSGIGNPIFKSIFLCKKIIFACT